MKIIDTNILNKFAKREIKIDLSDVFYVTEDLKNEVENLKSISLDYRNNLQQIKFVDVINHRYYDEAKYLENYKKFINNYNNIVSFYGLKGLGDISILSSVAIVISPSNPSLFDQEQGLIEIITNDFDLKNALIKEFGTKITINDPLEAK